MNLNPATQLIDAPHLGEGAKLEVDAIFCPDSDVLALIMHPNPVQGGTMHNKVISTLYRYCRDEKINVIRLNTRGVGKSDGVARADASEFEDVLCVLAWMRAQARMQGIDIRTIWSLGFSFGGYLACLLADWAHQQEDLVLKRVILVAPSIERHDVGGLMLPYDRMMMIFSDDDERVSSAVMRDFAKKYGISHVIVPNAGHFFHARLGDVKEAIMNLQVELDNKA